MAGKDVARVVNRCDTAKETNKLDLSHCELTQVPDAIFLLLKSTTLTFCDLSENLLKSIPPKLPRVFPFVSDLNLSTNKLSQLPDDIGGMEQLSVLDISHNSFLSLPHILCQLKTLMSLKAEDNKISDVDLAMLKQLPNLKEVNLKNNPLTLECHRQLMELGESSGLEIRLSPQDPDLDSLD